MPEIWHTANSAFAVPIATVGASPWATLGEYFAMCLGGFAVCPRHTAKPPGHTAKISPRVTHGEAPMATTGTAKAEFAVPNFRHTANNFAVCLSRYTAQKSKKTA